MFTIDQIKSAHSKVKSGADFPAYVQDLIALGVKSYDTFVIDGHTEYFGENGYKTQSDPIYPSKEIADSEDKEKFVERLKLHQQGGTDYLTFCADAAEVGVEKWTVDTVKMTCTYCGKSGGEMLVEAIPAASNAS